MAIIKHGNNALSSVTAFPSAVPTGKPVLISSATASSSASIEFTSGIDSTYDVYQFEFINIHPSSDNIAFQFQGSTNGGSSYGVTITSTFFNAVHAENDVDGAFLNYVTGGDLAQSTSYQQIGGATGNDNDQSFSGEMYLFAPSSTTYVKHFISRGSDYHASDYAVDRFAAGYFNSTSAINAIDFKFSTGNIDAGTIKLYGISS